MWLLEEQTLADFTSGKLEAATFQAIASYRSGRQIATVKGRDAIISIEGVLTEKPDYMAAYYGGGNTLYGDVVSAALAADADDGIDRIVYEYGTSPGGNVHGMFPAVRALQGIKKPTLSRVKNLAASAAFVLAATSDKIIAEDKATRFGCVGVKGTYKVKAEGATTIEIASDKAPLKIVDVTTPEGKAAAKKELNAMHDLLVEPIAAGRGITAEEVNENFGKGACCLAAEALENGMIDAIEGEKKSKNKSKITATSGKQQETAMDIIELRASHPDVFAKAVTLGVDQERKRVAGHIKVAQSADAMDIALKAIEEGSDLTSCQADYLAASIGQKSVEARGEETGAATPDAGPKTPKTEKTAEAKEEEEYLAAFEGADQDWLVE